MVELILAALVILVLASAFLLVRAKRDLARLSRELEKAWQEVNAGVLARLSALEELASALRQAGYAPEGEKKLWEALAALRKSTTDPRTLAEADERVETVLRGIYRALPRERSERLRQAQNRLAEADEELDLRKHRYNELVFAWHEMTRRFSYRFLARGQKKPEPLALPGEEEHLFRRYLLT